MRTRGLKATMRIDAAPPRRQSSFALALPLLAAAACNGRTAVTPTETELACSHPVRVEVPVHDDDRTYQDHEKDQRRPLIRVGEGRLLDDHTVLMLLDVTVNHEAVFGIYDTDPITRERTEELEVFRVREGHSVTVQLGTGEEITITVCQVNAGHTFTEKSARLESSKPLPYYFPYPLVPAPVDEETPEGLACTGEIAAGILLAGEEIEVSDYRVVLSNVRSPSETEPDAVAVLRVVDSGTGQILADDIEMRENQLLFFPSLGFAVRIDHITPGYTFGSRWADITILRCDSVPGPAAAN